MANREPSSASSGNTSFSSDMGTASGISSSTDGEKMYMPALMWLPTNVCGFSTKWRMRPSGSCTTTPYLEGSSTLVTMIVPLPPCLRWNASRSASGYSHVTSELKTKKGSPSLRCARASASGPAVPSGSGSCEHVSLTPYLASRPLSASIITSGL